MEPAEKFARTVIKLAFVVFAFIVSIVFEEFGHGSWGFLIFIIGCVFGGLALTVWKKL
jgi:hypothetical protein